jgi:rRNA maturation protein Nop10
MAYHVWNGCKCSNCGEVMHNWLIRNWSYGERQYVFEKECIKCGEKTSSKEHVPFGKMVLGRQISNF